MTLTRQAARGAAWQIAAGLISRIAGLVGTVIITHHIAPDVMGEVAAATVLAFTANWLSAWGFNQYVIVKGDQQDDNLFHVAILHLSLGIAALLAVVALEDHFTDFLNAPNLGLYLPGMALTVAIKRLASIPDKLLMRQMRFRTIAIANALGEFTYVGLAVSMVVLTDLGGLAIVIANVVQALLVSSIEVSVVGFRSWLSPKPWNWTRVREILNFGTPLALETILSEAGRYWDKLMFARLFGPHATGAYTLAYNLSDLPATYVGEHVASVLFPTIVQLDPERRTEIFCRSCGLLALIVFPMGVGLAAVADSLVSLVLSEEWQDVAGYLLVVPMIALFRPFNSVLASLLMATERNRLLLVFELFKVIALLGGMWGLSHFGEIAAAAAIGLAMGAQAAGLVFAMSLRGFPAGMLLRELRGPALASLVLLGAVFATREAFSHVEGVSLFVQLIAEIAIGAAAYFIGVAAFARPTAMQLMEIARNQLPGRRAEPHATESPLT